MFQEACDRAFTNEEFKREVERYDGILPHTDARLKTACTRVDMDYIESGEIFPLAMMMASHLEDTNGVGIAANQIGGDRRVMMLRFTDRMILMINPVIGLRRGHQTFVEKCLSVSEGNTGYAVKRSKKINVTYDTFRTDEDNELIYGSATGQFEGLTATCFQHELDHLNGFTIVDRGQLAHESPEALA